MIKDKVSFGLEGRVCIVTGGSQGIGEACVRRFAREGAKLVIADIDDTRGHALAAEIGGLYVHCDVADKTQVDALMAEAVGAHGRIDVLVNNAGSLVKRAPIAELTDELFDEVLHVNARSMMAFCREVVPAMRRQRSGGSIVNVTSVAARHGGGPGAALYAGAKGFVSTATRGLAKELVADRIRVNAVAPGVIVTPFHDQFSTPQMLESFKATIPMGRLGTADECVGAFLYLASETLAGYVTGQILEVNGGQYMP